MSVKKHLILTGVSTISWKDSISQAVSEASKSVDYISTITIKEQKAKIDGNKIIEFYSTIDLCFDVDSNRKS